MSDTVTAYLETFGCHLETEDGHDHPGDCDLARFLKNVHKRADGCWQWLGTKKESGYGRFYLRAPVRKYVPAHRWSYQHFVGPVPVGLEPDHLCRNRWCVNPACLEIVTHRVNVQRARYINPQCAKGHDYPEPGADGRRQCLTCIRQNKLAYKHRQRAKRPPREVTPITHNRSRYQVHGCRCDICCEAERSYQRERRLSRANGPQISGTHGGA